MKTPYFCRNDGAFGVVVCTETLISRLAPFHHLFELLIDDDTIRYVNAGRLRQAEGLAVYYPLGLSVPNDWSARY